MDKHSDTGRTGAAMPVDKWYTFSKKVVTWYSLHYQSSIYVGGGRQAEWQYKGY